MSSSLDQIVAGVKYPPAPACGPGRWSARAARMGGDLARLRAQRLAENALRCQQLLVLRRSIAHPAVTRADRALLVLLAGRVRAWRRALLVVRPETLLRWHRAGFRALWRRKSRPGPGRPPLPAESVALLRRIADENPRWGAGRIRGELRKLELRVAKQAIQTYLPATRAPRPRDLGVRLPSIADLCFRPLFAFFVIALTLSA